MTPYKVAGQARRSCPATPGLPNPKAAEVLSKYIITDMYAKAVQGMHGRGGGEVGRGRAEEGLRLSLEQRCRLATRDGQLDRNGRMTVSTAGTIGRRRRLRERAATPPARGRALARLRAARADGGAARPLHRLSVRRGRLAVADQHRGSASPASSSGSTNFVKASGTTASSGPRSATPSSTRASTTVFKLGARPVAGAAAQPPLPRQGASCAPSSCCPSSSRRCSRPSPGSGCSTRPSACINWTLFQLGHDHRRCDQLARRSRPRDDLDHGRQHLARRAVLRHHAAGRPADHQPRPARGRRASTAPTPGSASGTSPGRCSCRSRWWWCCSR